MQLLILFVKEFTKIKVINIAYKINRVSKIPVIGTSKNQSRALRLSLPLSAHLRAPTHVSRRRFLPTSNIRTPLQHNPNWLRR